MAGRIEQHSAPWVGLLRQRRSEREGPLLRRAEIIGSEVQAHDHCPRPDWRGAAVHSLRHQDGAGHLDPDARALGHNWRPPSIAP